MKLKALLATLGAGVVFTTTLHATEPKFLTLPFKDPEVLLQQGYYYDFTLGATDERRKGCPENPDHCHKGIDYIKKDANGNWISFEVSASDAGDAVYTTGDDCSDGKSTYGNRVKLTVTVDGKKRSTVYAHLASSTLQSGVLTPVKKGQKLGMSGDVGTCLPKGKSIHLHFEELDEYGNKIDPYGIKGVNTQYPGYPRSNVATCGADNAFIICPPRVGPLPYPIGSLIREERTGDGRSVYLVAVDDSGNIVKRHVTEQGFSDNHFAFADVYDVTSSDLVFYNSGKDITAKVTTDGLKEGELVWLNGKPEVYVVSAGKLYWLNMSPDEFRFVGYDFFMVRNVSGSYPMGSALTYQTFISCMAPVIAALGPELTLASSAPLPKGHYNLDPWVVSHRRSDGSMSFIVASPFDIASFDLAGNFLRQNVDFSPRL